MDENEWFKKFMGIPSEEQTGKSIAVNILAWTLGVLLVMLLISVMTGCDNYKKLRVSCKNACERVQQNNVGSTFMFADIHGTFGRCKCHAKDGAVKSFNISVKDMK